jgi:hypothetical protein
MNNQQETCLILRQGIWLRLWRPIINKNWLRLSLSPGLARAEPVAEPEPGSAFHFSIFGSGSDLSFPY